MELDGVSASLSPAQSGPIVQPQAAPEPPESEPVADGEEGGGKASGAVRKLNEGGHFKGVADVRLRISHFDNEDLKRIDPDLLPDPEDVPGKAYEKFLAQYRELYNASPPPAEPEEPVPETPAAPEEPVAETPPDPVLVIVPPLEIEPIAVPEQTEPEEPVDEGDGALAAFEELLDAQASQEEAETLDVVM